MKCPPLHILQSEGILHVRSWVSKARTALHDATFPQPFCSLAYKKQFVLCSFLPRILMQAIRLPLLCSSDNYQNSYVQFLFQAHLFFPSSPASLIYLFMYFPLQTNLSGAAEQQCAHSLPVLPCATWLQSPENSTPGLSHAHKHQRYTAKLHKEEQGGQCSEKLLYSPTQTVKPTKCNIKNKWEEAGFSHSYSFYRRLCLLQINVRWSKKPLHNIKSSSVSESCHQSTAQCQGAISWSDVRLYLWEREKEKQRH